MKRAFKVFVFVFVLAAVITLSSAGTLSAIVENEGVFFAGVFSDFSAWLGSVVFWKYVALAISLLVLAVFGAIWLVKRIVVRLKRSRKKANKVVKVETHQSKTSNEVRMSSPGKFIRVPPKDSKK